VHLNDGEDRTLYKAINDHHLTVVGKKIKNEFVVICSNRTNGAGILKTYKTRWSIERCFKNMKSQGFNLEKTHMTCKQRLKKLMMVVAIAILWCSLAGLKVVSPFKKTVKSPLYSVFTRGLRWMKNNLYQPNFTILFDLLIKSEG
jgi:transposase